MDIILNNAWGMCVSNSVWKQSFSNHKSKILRQIDFLWKSETVRWKDFLMYFQKSWFYLKILHIFYIPVFLFVLFSSRIYANVIIKIYFFADKHFPQIFVIIITGPHSTGSQLPPESYFYF